jgi:hypothetical protein
MTDFECYRAILQSQQTKSVKAQPVFQTQPSISVSTTAASISKSHVVAQPVSTTIALPLINQLATTRSQPVGWLTNVPIEISFTEFTNALLFNKHQPPRIDQYLNLVNNIQPLGGIQTKREAAMFLAQTVYETKGLSTLSEPFCTQTGCVGQFVTNLGMISRSYHGRGYLNMV